MMEQNQLSLTKTIDRTKATKLLSLIFLTAFIPFGLINLFTNNHSLGFSSLILAATLFIQYFLIIKQRAVNTYKQYVLIPCLVLFFSWQTYLYGITAAFWFYPLLMVIFIIIGLKQALITSSLVMVINLPIFFEQLDLATAIRLSVSLTLIAIFSTVFISIIRSQKIKILENEKLREEQKANTSHELKNSLATMLARVEAMQDGIRPTDAKQLCALVDSSEKLSKLIDDLNLLSLADVEQLALIKEKANLNQIINDSLFSYEGNLSEQNMSVNTNFEQEVYLEIDTLRIRQVFDNLISNCLKYTQEKGELFLSLRTTDKTVEIILEDTGPGVNEDIIPKLFERFYREDKDETQNISGSGLGLSIVNSLVKMHNGEVSAFSSPRGGLGIKLILPNAE